MTERYRLSFTTGGLFLQEAPMVAARYLQLGDWSATRNQLRDQNLLQVRTAAAATRISKEVTARLQELSAEEVSALPDLSLRDQANLLWVAVCRRYALLPPVFDDVSRDETDAADEGLSEELKEGGAAMAAYGRLQFEEMPFTRRESIESALLRYCELDTLAMVMAIQAWDAMAASGEHA